MAVEYEIRLNDLITKKLEEIKKTGQASFLAMDKSVDKFTEALDKAIDKLDKLNDKQEKTEKANKKNNSSFNATLGIAKKMAPILGTVFAVDKVMDFGKAIFKTRAEFQKYEAVLKNTLGSSFEAGKSFAMIQNIASATPFSVKELTSSYVKLVNQGFKPTAQQITSLGDLASSQGKSFDQLTEAVIDAQTGEFERLKEFGIRAKKEGDKVTFTFKGQQKQVDFTSSAIRRYITSLGDAQGVSGSMEAISKTLGGQLSNLEDSWDSFLNTLGKGVEGPIGKTIKGLSDMLGLMEDMIKVPLSDTLKQEQRDLNTLVRSVLKYNEGNETRKLLIDDLKVRYPGFLSNLDAEKTSNDEITKALENYNKQMNVKIFNQVFEEDLNEIFEKRNKLSKNLVNIEQDIIRKEDELKKGRETGDFGMKTVATTSSTVGGTFYSQVRKTEEDVKSELRGLVDRRFDIMRGREQTFQQEDALQRAFDESTLGKESNKITKQNNDEMKKLVKNINKLEKALDKPLTGLDSGMSLEQLRDYFLELKDQVQAVSPKALQDKLLEQMIKEEQERKAKISAYEKLIADPTVSADIKAAAKKNIETLQKKDPTVDKTKRRAVGITSLTGSTAAIKNVTVNIDKLVETFKLMTDSTDIQSESDVRQMIGRVLIGAVNDAEQSVGKN